ncbi:MAG: 1-phosphofructokinase [Chloroflexi bacterium]|nr:1-phosphofructokinase [Chloroflexota bacterium]
MIYTVTLNPAVDQTFEIEKLVLNDTNRVLASRTEPGGKGINVSRMLKELGEETVALGFLAGGIGRYIEHTLQNQEIFCDFVHTRGQTRTNITIIDHKSTNHTILSDRGPETAHRSVDELFIRLKRHIKDGDWLVIAGSIPPLIEPDIYARIIAFARAVGARTTLDADGSALSLGIEARPDLVKVNRRELERLLAREVRGDASIISAARKLHSRGLPTVIVTMGARGCVGVNDEGVWRATPPRITGTSAVGAGDAFVAGVVMTLKRGGSLSEGLRLGTAAGAATYISPGIRPCSRRDVEALLDKVEVMAFKRPCRSKQGA